MGVYFPNMEMPRCCYECDLCYDCFYCKNLEVSFYDPQDGAFVQDGFDPAKNGRGWDNWERVFRDLYDPPCPECNSRNAMVITTDLCEHPVECVCRNCGAWFSTDRE